jgi:hypothetical protein
MIEITNPEIVAGKRIDSREKTREITGGLLFEVGRNL